ncbi:hypothetical protein RDWZM_004847 [Blomia tropicalis]|uniref:TATA box binding protein associated factor (TAF) histone-like fold domain-containing protein n=1 Tax=Blomia tropicalis TaxID=40697 RepID=A0A9Q0M809_BLOTA|nr:hypothetical protein RDWZM_004847 [Blomia tropicalis]
MSEQDTEKKNDTNLYSDSMYQNGATSSHQLVARKSFSPESIRIMIEHSNIHMAVDDKVMEAISQTLNDRLIELIRHSSQSMIHSSRSKLTTNDVSKAMHDLDCDLIFGYNNWEPSINCHEYRFIPEANVFVHDDPLVDLKKESALILNRRMDPCTGDYNKTSKVIFNVAWLKSKNYTCDEFNISDQLMSNLKKYVAQIAYILEHIHDLDTEKNSLLRTIFRDIATNYNIQPIFNRLIRLAMNALTTTLQFRLPVSASIDQLLLNQTRLDSLDIYTKMICALTYNKHFITWSLNIDSIESFAQILLSICFGTHSIGTSFDLFEKSIQIRSRIAFLFRQVLVRHLPFTDQQQRYIRLLYSKIYQHIENLNTLDWIERAAIDWAILCLHRFLGFDLCVRYLLPWMIRFNTWFDTYFVPLQSVVSSDSYNIQIFANSLVRDQLCLVGELLMKGFINIFPYMTNDHHMKNVNVASQFFSHRFGDSLSIRLGYQFKPIKLKSVVDCNQTNETSSLVNQSKLLFHSNIGCVQQSFHLSQSLTEMFPIQSMKRSPTVFLYEDDFLNFAHSSGFNPISLFDNCQIVFEGIRYKRKVDNITLPVSYEQSKWYQMMAKTKFNFRPRRLRCTYVKHGDGANNLSYQTNCSLLLDDERRMINKNNTTTERQRTIHQYRMRHLLTSFSLYTHL